MEALVHQKKTNVTVSKAKTKFFLSLHYNSGNSYLVVKEKELYRFKGSNKHVNFASRFFLGSISNKFNYVDLEELCFKENVYNFQLITVLLKYLAC